MGATASARVPLGNTVGRLRTSRDVPDMEGKAHHDLLDLRGEYSRPYAFEILARARTFLLSCERTIMEPLNVYQVLAAYNASLTNVFKHKALTITGILEPKNNTSYGGKLYWYLVDGGARLTVHIPERSGDFSGRRVQVTGRPRTRL